MITYRDDDTRQIIGAVEPMEGVTYRGTVFSEGYTTNERTFDTEDEADGWVRGELGLS